LQNRPSAAKAALILSDLAARLKVVPFQNSEETRVVHQAV